MSGESPSQVVPALRDPPATSPAHHRNGGSHQYYQDGEDRDVADCAGRLASALPARSRGRPLAVKGPDGQLAGAANLKIPPHARLSIWSAMVAVLVVPGDAGGASGTALEGHGDRFEGTHLQRADQARAGGPWLQAPPVVLDAEDVRLLAPGHEHVDVDGIAGERLEQWRRGLGRSSAGERRCLVVD